MNLLTHFTEKEKLFLAACPLYHAETTAKNPGLAFRSLTMYLSNLKPWMGTIAATKFNEFYREQFKMYLANPLSTQVFDKVFKIYPLIPVTLAICLRIKLMSIEHDTPLFPNCDFSSDFPNGVGVKIAEEFDTLSQEEIRRYIEKYYKPLPDEPLKLKDDISRKFVYSLLKQLNFVVRINSNDLVKLNAPELARRLALVIIYESRIPFSYRTVTHNELASMRDPLDFENWSIESITRILAPALLRHAVEEHQCLCATPIPDRNFNHATFVPAVFNSLGVSDQPIDPTGLDYLLESSPTHQDEHQGDDAGVKPLASIQQNPIGKLWVNYPAMKRLAITMTS